MKFVVRPDLSTAAAGSSQAPTATVDNSAPRSTYPEPTYKSGKAVQRTGTTSNPADDSPAAEQKAQPMVRCPVCKVGCLRPIERLLPQAPVVASYIARLVLVVPETNTS
jgi:cytoskeletal protein RodZ